MINQFFQRYINCLNQIYYQNLFIRINEMFIKDCNRFYNKRFKLWNPNYYSLLINFLINKY